MPPRQQSWKRSNVQVFWGEVAHNGHVVQMYQSEDVLLDTLEGFVSTGILGQECVVIVATEFHLDNLELRLVRQALDVESLKGEGRLIFINAEEGLAEFMTDGKLNEEQFRSYASSVMKRAYESGRKLRAFGEMAGILVRHGNIEASLQLENLWNEIHDKKCSVFCAYSSAGFLPNAGNDIERICKAHTRLIDGYPRPATVMFHRPV